MTPFDVFTPTGVPTITYIDRPEKNLERQLADALRTPGTVISLSGPSKSGKTTLVRKVMSEEALIPISGGAIRSGEHLWERVLNWMDAPSETTAGTKNTTSAEVSGELGGKVSALIAGAELKGAAKGATGEEKTGERRFARGGIDQVVREIAGSDFVVFVDDFHYMDLDVQADVARQIKEASEKGVRICTASVPHRADDVVRRNPELRGRVRAIDFAYWEDTETVEIARRGFGALNLQLPDEDLARLAAEAFGSPQLMQQICLQLCLYFHIDGNAAKLRHLNPRAADLEKIFENASTTTDFASLVEALHSGPKKRGADRTKFDLVDGSKGDVYRCLLLILHEDPPRLSLTYDELYGRSKAVCVGDGPSGSSLNQALGQYERIAEEIQPGTPVLEWSEDVLDIADPYFLYYLRCSPRLAQLGRV